jgi:transcription initiation factor TFIID TATA-box-binding protein
MKKRTYTALEVEAGCLSSLPSRSYEDSLSSARHTQKHKDKHNSNPNLYSSVENESFKRIKQGDEKDGQDFAGNSKNANAEALSGKDANKEASTTAQHSPFKQAHQASSLLSAENTACIKSGIRDLEGCPEANAKSDEDVAPPTTIHNLVGTCEIAASTTPIDLEYVYRCLPNSFYDRKRFAAITIRVTEPVCTGLLFTSGKLVITGCKTLIECVLASLKIVRMLERFIPTVTFKVRNAVVQNVVAHVVLPLLPGQRLNVDRLYEDHCCNCTFQKNMFPGLIYRPDRSPVVLLCFYSGKIVITGGKKEEDIERGWSQLWPLIKQYVE